MDNTSSPIFQSPIYNYGLKVMFDYPTQPQLVPKFFPRVYVRELHNSLVSDPNYGALKDARDEYDNIIISYSTLYSLFPPQLKQMYVHYKFVCGCG